MVEATSDAGTRMMRKQACVSSLLPFFTRVEQYRLQELNKRVYEVMQFVVNEAPIAQCTVVLERKRTEFYLCRVTNNDFDQKYWKLFSIGSEDKPAERQYCEATLGFKEVYFQFFIRMSDYEYYAWPLIEEAFINEGYKLKFGNDWRLISSEKIECPPERLMRPTIMHVTRNDGKSDLLMCGGIKEQHSFMYDTVANTWSVLPKLPQGHNITCNVACNWKDRAMFTFLLDGSLNLRCAALNLKDMQKQPTKEAQTAAMSWALQMDAAPDPQANQDAPPFVNGNPATHNIDRFHVKCATVMDDDTIMVCARGRYPGMKEAVSTLFLRFKVHTQNNEFTLEMTEVQRCFPTVFPRQLDYMQRNGKNLILTQDTPDNDDFEIMAVFTDRKRERCGVNQIHKILTCNTLVDSPDDMTTVKIP